MDTSFPTSRSLQSKTSLHQLQHLLYPSPKKSTPKQVFWLWLAAVLAKAIFPADILILQQFY